LAAERFEFFSVFCFRHFPSPISFTFSLPEPLISNFRFWIFYSAFCNPHSAIQSMGFNLQIFHLFPKGVSINP
jgi:hypothetical protein